LGTSRLSLRVAAATASALALCVQASIAAPITASAASAALPSCGSTIAAGSAHALALRADGTVWAWGANFNGQLGNNDNSLPNSQSTPVQVTDAAGTGVLTGIVAIAAGGNHSMALRGDGTIWEWGANGNGELGNNDPSHTIQQKPVQVTGIGGSGFLTNVVAIAAGRYHSLAILDDGQVLAWGYNGGAGGGGQLGIDDTFTISHEDAPVHVHGVGGSGTLGGASAIGAGNYYSMALLSDGTVVTWGENDAGQLGNNTSNQFFGSEHPVHVLNADGVTNFGGVKEIAPNRHQAIALKTDGSGWGWGSNATAEIGTGTSGNHYETPVQVHGVGDSGTLGGVANLAEGGHQSLALLPNQEVLAWGKNSQGQVGDGSTTQRTSPVAVVGPGGSGLLGSVVELGAGDNFSLALKSDGTIWSFGNGSNGQLGDGTTSNQQDTPVQVSQASGLTAVPGGCLAVTAVQAASTSCDGGVPVTITGSGFLGATSVRFGGVEAQSFVVNSDTQITAVTPASSAGSADVTVTTPRGTSAVTGVAFVCAAAVIPTLPQAGDGGGRPPYSALAAMVLAVMPLFAIAAASALARRRSQRKPGPSS
jgi:alpha-tubulin suppressor-like RCC1 family protein